MPRQVRMEFPGATYHVMCRGDRRESIFLDDGDREMMLATLAETVGKTGWRVHAWVFREGKLSWIGELHRPLPRHGEPCRCTGGACT